MRPLLFVALAAAAAGCSDFRDAIHPGETRILTRDFLPAEVEHDPDQLYCYRTLAEEVCHRVALRNQRNRMVGHYGAPPEAVGR